MSQGYPVSPIEIMERREARAKEAKKRTEETLKRKSGRDQSDQIRNWIRCCNELHEDTCVSKLICEWNPNDVPAWLIDTHQNCLVPGHTADRYLALSYTWEETREEIWESEWAEPNSKAEGSTPRTLLHASHTTEQLTTRRFLIQPGIRQRIPDVIQLALHLTKAIGERYLWVDRLCIVQDDLAPGGTLSQVSKMDKIYSGAYLTIIAATKFETTRFMATAMEDHLVSAATGTLEMTPCAETVPVQGLARDNFSNSVPAPDSNRLPPMPHSQNLEDKCLVSDDIRAHYGKLSRSKWGSRGWTYQEQILCARAVIIHDSGQFWDCQHCLWDDVRLCPQRDPIPKATILGRSPPRIDDTWWPDFRSYVDLICPYNGRKFAFDRDAALGILGILNVLSRSFVGGFVHGLPALFLDHALLWQPFGFATRRQDGGTSQRPVQSTSLPSWSWLGWQGYVDPLSQCSGLWYIHDEECQRQARSLRTFNLVQWTLFHEDGSSTRITDPLNWKHSYGDCTPANWSSLSIPNIDNGDFWKHVHYHRRDPSAVFTQPVPTVDSQFPPSIITESKYLACSTNVSTFVAATTLYALRTGEFAAFQKASVFEDSIFKNGPPKNERNPILVLRQDDGRFAGLLTLMTREEVDDGAPVDLMAISAGSIAKCDLESMGAWQIYRTGTRIYNPADHKGQAVYEPRVLSLEAKSALLYTASMAFGQDGAHQSRLDSTLGSLVERIDNQVEREMEEWHSRHSGTVWDATRMYLSNCFYVSKWMRLRNKLEFMPDEVPKLGDDSLCEFYNVLWIERKDGIAYRRACGWVPKYVWEANANGPAEINLG